MCSERGAAFPEVNVPFKITEIKLRSLKNGSLVGKKIELSEVKPHDEDSVWNEVSVLHVKED